jgi:hypothetical protein
MNQQEGADAIGVASMPWALTQHEPLDTSAFINEAQKRGVSLDLATLRELYRRRLLIPFIMITHRPERPPAPPVESESPFGGTRLMDLRRARDTGRLRDLFAIPYTRSVTFERDRQKSRDWWNGLIYSWYQLLVLPQLEPLLAGRTYQKRGGRLIARLLQPDPILVDRADKLRKLTMALTALEPRYLPNLDPEWIQLSNAPDPRDWQAYRAGFDSVQMRAWLQYPAEQVRQDAEWLLSRAHHMDPVGPDWARLMRRGPTKSRKYLKDASLLAMDDRIAAEILLRFYEDLAYRGQAEPLPDLSASMAWHPLHERLSFHPDTLDEDLIRLGISPHPRVVLALEGDTEMYHAPRVWRALEYSDAPELMRLLKLGSVSQDLKKVAALTAAPLVSEKIPGGNTWRLIKPYTRLLVAVDPEGPFATQAKVDKERGAILDEIRDVLHAQGLTHPNDDELNELVEIRTWQASCYEFAHFTDDELADGIIAVHQTIDGWTRDELVAALAYWRGESKDIKLVWFKGRPTSQHNRFTGKWGYEVSKVKLAEALWPTLERKIEQVKADANAPVPPIAGVVNDAYHLAQQWRYLSFILTEKLNISDEAT